MIGDVKLRFDSSLDQAVAPQDAVTMALLEAIDEPVGGDGGHVRRVQRGAQLLAEQLRRDGIFRDVINDEFVENLYRASALHDIGKIGINRLILSKPGPLTTAEFEAVKEHVRIGSQLLKRAGELAGNPPFLTMAADIALYHHERYDGTGYCAGLKGAEIPLAARIVALADVHDALTSTRVYKPARDADEAKRMIASEAGKHFDPVIVDAFHATYPEFVAVLTRRQSASVSN